MTYDLSRSHPNNPFRQPEFIPAKNWLRSGSKGISGSRWLGFGPKTSKVDTQVVHYQGSQYPAWKLATDDANVIKRLNGMNDESWSSRGYALYYGFDLPTDGRLWGIRAFDWRNAANADGNPNDGNENDWTFAVHTVLQKLSADNSDKTVEPTWEQLETLRWLRWEAREYAIEAGNGSSFEIDLIGHRDLEPTGCPGDRMYAAIQAGKLDIPPRTAPKPDPAPTPAPGGLMITVFKPKEGADLKGEVVAEFIAMVDDNGNALEVRWIATAEDVAVRDAHLAAGAREDNGDCTKGRFRNCDLRGPVPVGATYQWTADDFWHVYP